MRARGTDWWWDHTWNPVGGCSLASPGCANCYAQQIAGTRTWPFAESASIHHGVTLAKGRRRIFNGKLTVAPEGHHLWTWPLRWLGAQQPKLGSGKPSLIFVGDMSDLFHEGRDDAIIDRVCATIAVSDHIGLLLTQTHAPDDRLFQGTEAAHCAPLATEALVGLQCAKRHKALLADMHDPTMDLSYRIKVAKRLIHARLGDTGSVPSAPIPYTPPSRYEWQIAKLQRSSMPKDQWRGLWCKRLLVRNPTFTDNATGNTHSQSNYGGPSA